MRWSNRRHRHSHLQQNTVHCQHYNRLYYSLSVFTMGLRKRGSLSRYMGPPSCQICSGGWHIDTVQFYSVIRCWNALVNMFQPDSSGSFLQRYLVMCDIRLPARLLEMHKTNVYTCVCVSFDKICHKYGVYGISGDRSNVRTYVCGEGDRNLGQKQLALRFSSR